MKEILKVLVWLIYHKTENYVLKKVECPNLHYNEYYLYRIDKILLFKHRAIKETATSLNEKKKNMWYYNYPNLKEI